MVTCMVILRQDIHGYRSRQGLNMQMRTMSFLRSAKERLVHIINTCQHSSTNVCHVPSYRLWQERISRSRERSTYALLVMGVSFPSMGIEKYATLTVCRRFPWRCKGLMGT